MQNDHEEVSQPCGFVTSQYWGLFYMARAYCSLGRPNRNKHWFRSKEKAQEWLLWQFTYAIWSEYIAHVGDPSDSDLPTRIEVAKLYE